MDVTALYTNIDYDRELECVGKYLERVIKAMPSKQRSFLLDRLRFILDNNYSNYNRKNLPSDKGDCNGHEGVFL